MNKCQTKCVNAKMFVYADVLSFKMKCRSYTKSDVPIEVVAMVILFMRLPIYIKKVFICLHIQ